MTTRSVFPAVRLALIAVLSAAVLAACGGDGADVSDAPTTAAASTEQATESSAEQLSPGDIEFLTMMIPHHGQALEMTALAETRAESADVKALAAEIAAAQGPEIALMQDLLRQAGQPVPDPSSTDSLHAGHAHSDMMAGMLSAEEMDDLAALSGHDFDHLFLTGMIYHHEGAVAMAQERLAESTSPAIRDLAATIDETQRAEIRRMKALDLELSQHEGH